MPTVGDVIVRVRNAAADPCQTLGQPFAPVVADGGTGGIFSGSTFFIITYLTAWGETPGSTEVNVSLPAAHAAILGGLSVPYAATTLRVYFSSAPGQETQYLSYPIDHTVSALTVGLIGDPVVSATPPFKSSAYLPDSDGDLVSASDIYRWINAGLVEMGRLAGGILDQTGVAIPAGNAEVVIPGWWLKIQSVWHNGWQLIPERQDYTWLQSPVGGIPGISTLWRNGAQQVIGTWPQPSTAPANTFLTAPMSATDTMAQVLDSTDFHGIDGVCATNTNNFSSATGGFSSAMVGLVINIAGAGAGGAAFITTIVAVVSAHILTLAAPVVTGVVNAIFDIVGGPGLHTSTINFTAPGMCQIDNEIMSYSAASLTALTGIVRGYSGTIPAAHATDALVTQLILRLLGRRMPVPVALGQSANTLDLPQGWDVVLDRFLLSFFKQTEQNVQEAAALMAEFKQGAIDLRDDQIPMASKQIGGLYPLGGNAENLAEVMDFVIVN